MQQIYIDFPIRGETSVLAWQALLIGGFVRSTKDAKACIRMGYVLVDGERLPGIDARLDLGRWYTLEYKKPSNRKKEFRVFIRSKWRN